MSAVDDRVFFGSDAEARVASALQRFDRVLLVARERYTDGIDRLAALLGDRVAGRFVTDVPQVPGEVADAAVARARELEADALLVHGGGSPLGVAKAVALETGLPIAAIPTTYAGSERTNIWGITRDGEKTTGRDDRVRPVIVGYDPSLVTLPLEASVQSLCNALAHSIEALYAVEATEEARRAARESLAPLVRAMRGLIADPDDAEARRDASFGAWKASEALDGASMALHHKLAHVLGGSHDLPHGPTHATLLPHTLGFNLTDALLTALSDAWETDDPAAFLYDLQRDAGISLSLKDLTLREESLEDVVQGVLAKRYDNPRDYDADDLRALLADLYLGRRPSRYTRREALAIDGPHGAHPASLRGPDRPRKVVVALHGRGASADRFLGELVAIADAADVLWIAPQAARNSWYPKGYLAPLDDNQPFLDSALSAVQASVDRALAHVAPEHVVVVGFSQGACLALTWLSSTDRPVGTVLSFTGAHTPLPTGDFGHASGVDVHLERSHVDPWIDEAPFDATVSALRNAGAAVHAHTLPGDTHALHPPLRTALSRVLES
jgi:maleylacetate reductase